MPTLGLIKVLDILSAVEASAANDPDPDVKAEAIQVRKIIRSAERGTLVDQALNVFTDTERGTAIRLRALELLQLIALAETS